MFLCSPKHCPSTRTVEPVPAVVFRGGSRGLSEAREDERFCRRRDPVEHVEKGGVAPGSHQPAIGSFSKFACASFSHVPSLRG